MDIRTQHSYDTLMEWYDQTVEVMNASSGAELAKLYQRLPVRFFIALSFADKIVWFGNELEVYRRLEPDQPFSLMDILPKRYHTDADKLSINDLTEEEVFTIKAFIFGVLNSIVEVYG